MSENISKKIWYLFDKDEKYGPFSSFEIAELIIYDKVIAETYAIDDKMKQRVQLNQIELFRKVFLKKREVNPLNEKAAKVYDVNVLLGKKEKKDDEKIPEKKDAGVRWFLFDDQKKDGPFTTEEIDNILTTFKLGKNAYASTEDGKKIRFPNFNKNGNVNITDSKPNKLKSKWENKLSRLPFYKNKKLRVLFNLKVIGMVFFGFLVILVLLVYNFLSQKNINHLTDQGASGGKSFQNDSDLSKGQDEKRAKFIEEAKLLDGVVLKKFDDGKILEESNYKNGILTGKHERWYSNGKVEEKCEFSDKGLGKCITWYDNGNKKSEGPMRSSIDLDGNSIKEKIGTWRHWKVDGSFEKKLSVGLRKKEHPERHDFVYLSRFPINSNFNKVYLLPNNNSLIVFNMSEVVIHDLKTNKIKNEFTNAYDEKSRFLSYSRNFFITKNIGTLSVIDSVTSEVKNRKEFKGNLEFVSISPNDKYILTIQKDPIYRSGVYNFIFWLRIYQTNDLKMVFENQFEREIFEIKFSSDSNYLLAKAYDWQKKIETKVFNINKKKSLISFKDGNEMELSDITPDSRFMYLKRENMISFISLNSGKTISTLKVQDKDATIGFSKSGKYFYVKDGSEVNLFSFSPFSVITKFKYKSKVRDALFSKKDNFFISFSVDGNFKIFNIGKKGIVREYNFKSPARNVAISDSEKLIAILFKNNQFQLFNIGEKKPLLLDYVSLLENSMAFDPNENFIFFSKKSSPKNFYETFDYVTKLFEVKSVSFRSVLNNNSLDRHFILREKSVLSLDSYSREINVTEYTF